MFESITNFLLLWAQTVPIEIFTFVGSFIEEVLAPIPSPIVMTVTGSIAAAQEKPMMYLLVLSLIGAAGKTIGAVLVYWIADKAEDILVGRFGKLIGVTHAEIEALGKKFKGTWKDIFLLIFLRALPIMPSVVVSVTSGVVRIRLQLYIISTFLGTIVRDFFYLYVGFTGIEVLHNLIAGFDSVESIVEAIAALIVIIVIGWIYWKRRIIKKGQSSASLG